MPLFFFQAEDGIRDLTVTGVQTCALPISSSPPPALPPAPAPPPSSEPSRPPRSRPPAPPPLAAPWSRCSAPKRLAAPCGSAALRPSEASSTRSEEHTSELQSQSNLVCRLLLEKK